MSYTLTEYDGFFCYEGCDGKTTNIIVSGSMVHNMVGLHLLTCNEKKEIVSDRYGDTYMTKEDWRKVFKKIESAHVADDVQHVAV